MVLPTRGATTFWEVSVVPGTHKGCHYILGSISKRNVVAPLVGARYDPHLYICLTLLLTGFRQVLGGIAQIMKFYLLVECLFDQLQAWLFQVKVKEIGDFFCVGDTIDEVGATM